jgi:hypothetical protein
MSGILKGVPLVLIFWITEFIQKKSRIVFKNFMVAWKESEPNTCVTRAIVFQEIKQLCCKIIR